ncbi:ribonuclease P protein component [Sphingobacterium sp. DK4209]|uniref:Ribonuclease P protein component n=1 Tax=Sphingobacterium zhuxiongii TaxID=2662364 RepID=A0A5Q0QH37_9SPHI|nr:MULTISPECIES: ribonuclease P protein component [unclassified Sphingobacterium]MVZ65525.1 ribonuclease P protein component [Sphingobacterium sp. DK4209]QGA27328.1 ribonuclease P protein component [Sphingobacterium sp. dk4302]
MKKYTFSKEERLCSKRLIDDLFHNGSSFVVYPFRLMYRNTSETLPSKAQAIISVSKRRFKHAVTRNRLKRLLRECYRLEKPFFYDNLSDYSLHLLLAIQYIGKEELPFVELHAKMKILLEKLSHELASSNLGKRD